MTDPTSLDRQNNAPPATAAANRITTAVPHYLVADMIATLATIGTLAGGVFMPMIGNQVLGAALLPHVASNAALAARTDYSQPIVRDGVAAPGDGGQATFIHIPKACSLASGSGDLGAQVRGSDGNCWVLAKGTQITPDLWPGADSTGAGDSTYALKSFFNYIGANHIAGVCPAGTYKFTSQIQLTYGNWSLSGTCVLTYAGTSTVASPLNIEGPSDSRHINNISMVGPSLFSTTTMTAGWGIYVEYADNVRIDMTVGDYYGQHQSLYNAVGFHRAFYDSLDGLVYSSHFGVDFWDGIQLVLGPRQLIANGVGDSGFHAGGGWGGAFFVNVAQSCLIHTDGNVYGSSIDFAPVGLRVDNAGTPVTNYQLFVSNITTFDSCKAAEVYINDTGTMPGGGIPPVGIRNFSFDGWAGGSHGAGIPGIALVKWGNGTLQIGGGATLINGSDAGLAISDASARVTIDPAAWIGQNAGYGVLCNVPTHNIQSDAAWLTNTFADYSPQCQGNLPKAAWLSYTPTVACTSGTLGTYTATGRYRMSGFTTVYQVEIKNTAAGSCTAMTYTLPVDGTGQTKRAGLSTAILGVDQSNGNLTRSFLAKGSTTAALAPVTAGQNLQGTASDNFVAGTYMNNTGQ